MHEIEAKAILSAKNGMNVYRGCTHGCIYCDSRSTCYQMDHVFEDVAVKVNAPELLEVALRRKRRPCMVGTGSMCDPYLPLEREAQVTRRCLEVIRRHGCGVSILTKSDLILRDLELLKEINQQARVVVCTTFTTFDESLCRVLEPHAPTTRQRFEMLRTMRENGIATGVWLGPILPFLNDTEENLQGLLDYCWRAGVEAIVCFGMGVTLRDGSREHFYRQLDRHFPGLRGRYTRAFGQSYVCPSPNEKRLQRILEAECRARGVIFRPEEALAWMSAFEDETTRAQQSLFT